MRQNCACSSDKVISNIPTWDVATSTVIRKLADLNDRIVTRGNSIQPGTLKRDCFAITCCSMKRVKKKMRKHLDGYIF